MTDVFRFNFTQLFPELDFESLAGQIPHQLDACVEHDETNKRVFQRLVAMIFRWVHANIQE